MMNVRRVQLFPEMSQSPRGFDSATVRHGLELRACDKDEEKKPGFHQKAGFLSVISTYLCRDLSESEAHGLMAVPCANRPVHVWVNVI